MNQLTNDEVESGGFISCPGRPGYRIAMDGRVLGKIANRVLLATFRGDGYPFVSVNGVAVLLAALLCEAFHGPRPTSSSVVVRLSGPASDCASDVRWGTRQECYAERRKYRDRSTS